MTRLNKIGLGHWAIASFAFTLSACGVFWAGGVDEEQNTVAGVNEENNTDIKQNTDQNKCITRNDSTYCVSSVGYQDSKVPAIDINDPIKIDPVINRDSANTEIPTDEPTLATHSYNIKGYVAKDLKFSNSIEIALVDTTFYVQGNSDGMFEIAVPEGTYSFIVRSVTSEGNVSESNYYLTYGSRINVLGPVPTSVANNVDAEDLEAPPVQTVVMPPVTGMTPDPDPVDPLPDSATTSVPPQDTTGNNSDVVILLPNDPDYGLVYHWNGSNMPANESTVNDSLVFAEGLEELTFEITFKVTSFPESLRYSKNVFGKKGLFNLAITKSVCYVQEPALAFFIGNGFDYSSCHDKALASSATIEVGKEITVTGVWDGKHVMLYKDGFLIAEQTLTKIADINYITADNIIETPFVFGDKDLDISIIDARLGNKAISSADVLYRHYLKGGAQ